MKSIANQYRDLKEGKLSQFNFMRNLRMTMPQYITNTTSFNDVVRILKSKSILTEAFDPRDAADTAAEELAIAAGDYDAAVGMLQDEMGLSFSAASAIAARVYEPEPISGEEDYMEDEMPRDDFPMSDYNDGEFWEAKVEESPKPKADIYGEDPNLDVYADKDIPGQGMTENEEDDDAETLAMIDKIEQEMAGEEAVKAQYDITEAKQKVDADRVHPQELSMGIKVEMEHTKDAEKAKKIALDHLAENPFYYTQLKLSGVDVKATPNKEKKAIAKKKDETELVDKANQMKPVKGVEKAKASANKASKETNKPVKGISLMSLIAKTSRGVKKMEPTGEKMKVVKEDYQSFLAQKKREEEAAETYGGFKRGDKVMIDPDAAKATGLKAGKVYTITNFRVYKAGSILQNVDALLDNGEEINVDYIFKAPKVFTSSTNLGGYDLNKLKEMVREVLAEMESDDEVTADVALGMDETMDGRDNLTDTAGHQLDENK